MDKICIEGGARLEGVVEASGAKNAALPILVSSLLTAKPSVFRKVPELMDIRSIAQILETLGASIDVSENEFKIHVPELKATEAPYDLVRKMRASVLVLGPLVAREGQAKVSLPGGCAIGARPIDIHIFGLKKLGAQIDLEQGYVLAKAKRLKGDRVSFRFPSVGATESVMMAAALADGETLMENCAREPEIVDLADALKSMGVEIEGAGTAKIRIQGRTEIDGANHEVMGDRIEAGTLLASAMMTSGDVTVEGIKPEHLESVLQKFESAGAQVDRGATKIRLVSKGRPGAVDVDTQPFPGFPTDMQAQMMAAMCISTGTSVITENIFENRFMHVPELCRLGADIQIKGKTAVVRGKEELTGAPLMATDLRASASLVLAALKAKGETWVNRVYHLDRGYDRLEQKLKSLGAQIRRVSS